MVDRRVQPKLRTTVVVPVDPVPEAEIRRRLRRLGEHLEKLRRESRPDDPDLADLPESSGTQTSAAAL